MRCEVASPAEVDHSYGMRMNPAASEGRPKAPLAHRYGPGALWAAVGGEGRPRSCDGDHPHSESLVVPANGPGYPVISGLRISVPPRSVSDPSHSHPALHCSTITPPSMRKRCIVRPTRCIPAGG